MYKAEIVWFKGGKKEFPTPLFLIPDFFLNGPDTICKPNDSTEDFQFKKEYSLAIISATAEIDLLYQKEASFWWTNAEPCELS